MHGDLYSLQGSSTAPGWPSTWQSSFAPTTQVSWSLVWNTQTKWRSLPEFQYGGWTDIASQNALRWWVNGICVSKTLTDTIISFVCHRVSVKMVSKCLLLNYTPTWLGRVCTRSTTGMASNCPSWTGTTTIAPIIRKSENWNDKSPFYPWETQCDIINYVLTNFCLPKLQCLS